MTPWKIPFNRTELAGRELEYLADSIARGHISGDGYYTTLAQGLLQEMLGAPRVLLTTSCTDALELAAVLLGIGPGDEVVVPSYTFVSTANAFALHGARIVFADVRPDTLNLDEEQLERLITRRTRAIVVVHYAGVGCEMDAILAIARRYNVPVIEDNAHGLLGKYKDRYLGTWGCLSTLSFHETKNFSCGEGGALVINEPSYTARAEIVREKGTDRSQFFRGEIDKYTWRDIGSSHLPSDMLAAFLYAQLEQREAIQTARATLWHYYAEQLAGWARHYGVGMPCVPPYCEQAYHMFYLLMPTPAARDALLAHLRAQGISAVFHYVPLHLSSMGRQFGGRPGDCPVTEDISRRLVRLPFFRRLSQSQCRMVVEAVRRFDVAAQQTTDRDLGSLRKAG